MEVATIIPGYYYEVHHEDFDRKVFRVFHMEGHVYVVARDLINLKSKKVENATKLINKNCLKRKVVGLPNKTTKVNIINVDDAFNLINVLDFSLDMEQRLKDLVLDIEIRILEINNPKKPSLWSRIKTWFKKLFHRG